MNNFLRTKYTTTLMLSIQCIQNDTASSKLLKSFHIKLIWDHTDNKCRGNKNKNIGLNKLTIFLIIEITK